MTRSFREHLFAADAERLAGIRGLTAREYAEAAKHDEFTGGLIEGWRPLYPGEPFRGITADGILREDVHDLAEAAPQDAAPTDRMVARANDLLSVLSPTEAARISYPIDAREWRSWANPEFLQYDTGLRLEDISPVARDAFFNLVEASLSPEGYQLVRDCMRINGFLGGVVGLESIMNEFSYNVAVYGEPSPDQPWGWQLFGHHVAVNCAVIGTRMVISPVFLGAEPDVIDEGPFEGTKVFDRRIELGRRLMASLTGAQRDAATTYASLVDDSMPEGRVHPGDERHLGGAFQDNRVIPIEGVQVGTLSAESRELIYGIVAEFNRVLPEGPARMRLEEVRRFETETWFSWIGGWQGDEPFYFRIQSPVAIFELDHHCGVFLDNTEPAAFHIHTVLRTPNGNDYGRLLSSNALGRPLAG